MRIEQVDERYRALASYRAIRRAWPEFLLHDAISNEHWHRLYDDFPQFQFVAVEDGDVLAEGCAIPVRGLPKAWRQAFLSEGEPDRLFPLRRRPSRRLRSLGGSVEPTPRAPCRC